MSRLRMFVGFVQQDLKVERVAITRSENQL